MEPTNETRLISKADLRQAMQAIRNDWPTPLDKKLEIRAQAQAVVDSPTAHERSKRTAAELLAAIEAADWCETLTENLR